MYELPDELWNIIKDYQLDWKKKHKKNLFKVTYEINYLYDWHCCETEGPYLPHEVDSEVCGHYFHHCYFDKSWGGWKISRKKRLKYIEDRLKGIIK